MLFKFLNNKVRGVIQAWLYDVHTKQVITVFVKDYNFKFKKNLTPNEYLYDLAASSNGSVDLQYKYVAVSTAAAKINRNTTLELEKARVVPDSITVTNNKVVILTTFGTLSANTESTTIDTVTSKSVFTVDDVSGLNEGDLIKVGTQKEIEIDIISGSEITLKKPLLSTPSASDPVKQVLARLHLAYGSSATSSLNSGKAASIAKIEAIKTSTQILTTRHEIEFLGV